MSSTPDRAARGLLVVGSTSALARAGELLAAHALVRPVRAVVGDPLHPGWRSHLAEASAVLLVADPSLPVASVVDATHVHDGDRAVPVGVVPDDPRAFATAALVQRRGRLPGLGRGPYVVLSSREDHVRERADRLARALSQGTVSSRHLPTGRIDRATLLAVLASGPGLAIYTGEGGPHGWGGYGRVRTWELDDLGPEPVGALVSLSCSGSARLGSLHGLCESVVAHGTAACALGAVSEVPSEDDDRLGMLLAERLRAGAANLAEALPVHVPELAPFRISGDPLAPFTGAPGSAALLRGIEAPGVGERLPAVAWG